MLFKGDLHEESKRLYAHLAEQSSDALYLFYEGHIEYVNASFLKLFGYTFEELTAQDFDFMTLVAPGEPDASSRNVCLEHLTERLCRLVTNLSQSRAMAEKLPSRQPKARSHTEGRRLHRGPFALSLNGIRRMRPLRPADIVKVPFAPASPVTDIANNYQYFFDHATYGSVSQHP